MAPLFFIHVSDILRLTAPRRLRRIKYRIYNPFRKCNIGIYIKSVILPWKISMFVLTMVVHDLLCPNVRELTYSLSNRKIENPEANAPGFCHALIS